MVPLKYVLLFVAIQLVSLVLTVIGIPVILVLEFLGAETLTDGKWHLPRWAWIFDNAEDGVAPSGYTMIGWYLRNPVNNLRFVRGVSKVGRPLWRKTWGAKPGGWYVQAGWNPSGYPVLSAGRNVNPW